MEYPRLKAHYVPVVLSPRRAFLLSEERRWVVQGPTEVKLLPYLDGRHSLADIADALGAEASLSDILLALRRLERNGHLAEGRPDYRSDELAYWDALEVDAHQIAAERTAATVSVAALGDVEIHPVVDALASSQVTVRVGGRESLGGDALVVVVVDDYLAHLEQLNADLLSAKQPWLLVKPRGTVLWLGPLFSPGSTGCWQCLEQRLRSNRQVERYVLDKRGDGAALVTARGQLQSTSVLAANLVAEEVLQYLGRGTSSRLDGVMTTFDLRSYEAARHALVRQPQCPACGDPSLVTEREPRVTLQSRKVAFNVDGGYRCQTPAETFDRLQKHISSLLGAVTWLRPISESQSGLTFTYSAGHNFAFYGEDLDALRRNLRGQSGGKGRTDLQARVSAVAEAIERYCGVWRGSERVRRATCAELEPGQAVLPNQLLLFSEAQFAERTEWNAAKTSRLQIVPKPFDPAVACDWTESWSLTHERVRLVPSAYVWYGHPDSQRLFHAFADSNGNAAGNVLEEAILQGLCEAVERDGVAIWWYSRARRPAFDLASLDEPYVEMLRRYYTGIGRSLHMLDVTTDLGVPTFAAVSARLDGPTEDILLGFGAHLDPRIAALRALTEVNQWLPAVTGRYADGSTQYHENDAATLEWWRTATLDDHPYLRPDPELPPTRAEHYACLASDDIAVDVADIVERMRRVDLEVLVVDQTRPEIELRVVKVLVPGLRHMWRRLGEGRLYDVPVALGWIPRRLDETELNPVSVFF